MIKKKLTLFCLLSVIVFTGFKVPKNTGYITDEANLLNAKDRQTLSQYAKNLDQQTSIQVATVIIKDLEGLPIEEAAQAIFKEWKIGQKGKDNGLLFLISTNEKKVRIEVGYGLEGLLPDGKVGRLLDENFIPFAKSGQLSSAIINSHLALLNIIAKDKNILLELPTPPIPQQQKKEIHPIIQGLLLILFIFFLTKGRRFLWPLLLILSSMRGGGRGGFGGGGGFGGFGGGGSGGGGSSRNW
jgi:uncharacterized protein